ncbi:hypothetical protein [Krasilnikoviella flava]|uniref:Uncharacterized protein n=1 Tax=Krasilnikoviella flava TaxID=526729 RepID=A0A1T5LVL2_9MICO|nr:hypothetical protein [Krasilnikoviella flava]SKC79609.1 hypothetical protein SAMN04324258_3979 [Krasilnikoviella flava]
MDSPQGAVPPQPRPTTPDRPPVARAWRLVAAAAVLVSAVVHVVLYLDGYDTIAVVGPLFLLNAVAGLVLAVLLVVWRHWLPLVGGIGFGGATLLAFVLSTTVGFYGVNETFAGTNEIVAAASEVVAVVASAVALLREYVR